MGNLVTILQICIGISWAGCGQSHRVPFPTVEACQQALATMVVSQPTTEKVRGMLAYCRPPIPGEELRP